MRRPSRVPTGEPLSQEMRRFLDELDRKIKNSKYDATVAPAVTDDDAHGYEVGSTWVNVTADDAYACVDATTGAAVWKKTTP